MTSTTSQSPVVVGYQDHGSDDALEWACQEAGRRGAPVRVLHAYAREQLYPWGYGYPLPVGDLAGVEEKMRARASSLLEEAAERVRARYPGLPLTATLAGSSPDAGLVTASQDATLLVVGRHERPPRGASHGSVSLSVAAHAACPIVVVPSPPAEGAAAADADGSGDIEVMAHAGPPPTLAALFAGQVVVGVDDSPEAADAVGFAFTQAAARGVGLVALHAWWVDPVLLAPSMPVDWNEMGAADQGAIDGLLAPWRARCPEVKVARDPRPDEHGRGPGDRLVRRRAAGGREPGARRVRPAAAGLGQPQGPAARPLPGGGGAPRPARGAARPRPVLKPHVLSRYGAGAPQRGHRRRTVVVLRMSGRQALERLTADSGEATSSSDLPSASTPRNDLDEAADDHDAGADEVAQRQQAVVAAVADERAVEPRAEGAEALRDREEERDGLGADSIGKISLTVR